ncbi:conserved hypothetical protein [Leishmania braziliensis MHOM/BR/75/M2904]|uniref:PH-like domain-containing protein n=2 Tax=Leishmania braziliensis TaxID=5660 RepID=A4HEC6_LEIBR|nr:conserved hypothetical protein [Leishmania braziliensis MHOM/BR/75/M2904]KAI5690397.1 hypothetical protein MNV84_04563 [Leishmania braziliensis]CAJ2474414.1 unnamed protein product [Leishmania braziliensis]CAM39179.1 conserved hypothetical protein [Leishmania braziliensis MHOM/BR/75/M2904]SYZ66640.1 hypothetical_protein [Leishmania braziliensis MHOM/BR/75/M2904]
MPRQPTKNRINMHDIVEQPLSAIPDAVDAVLRRPEPLDELEVQSIFFESSYILLRAEEALSAKDGNAFCALFKIFSEGFAHSETSFEEGIRTVVQNDSLLQTMHSIFKVVVEQEALPLHSAGTVELIQVLSSLCDGAALKDKCGAVFMRGFAKVLQRAYSNAEEARRHFHVQRGTATALINLVKGSKQNKQRLASWKFVADCCAASVDVFFQLQCVELLFRVSRQNKDVFSHLGGSLPLATIEELRALPNDGTLLSRMTLLIEHLNEGRAQVLRYPLKEVVAAETTLTSSTNAYFTPNYVIVMVTAANADNITIPYRIIRSITLGRDGRVIVRLEEFPVKLELLLSRTAGMDTVTFYMAQEDLATFKQSPVRQWIVEALQARKEEQHHHLPPQAPRSPDSTAKPAGKVEWATHKPLSSTATAASGAAAAAPCEASGDIDTARKKARLESATTAAVVPYTNQPPIGALLHGVDALVEQATTPNEAQAMLLQLRRLMEARKEVQRGKSLDDLSDAMQRIQSRVDEARRTAKENRAAWHQAMLEELERVEALVVGAQDKAAAGVEQLNDHLKKVKASNQAINERIACMDVELQRTLEELREEERRWTSEIHTKCMREAERLEFEVDQQLLNRSRPMALLSDYMRH